MKTVAAGDVRAGISAPLSLAPKFPNDHHATLHHGPRGSIGAKQAERGSELMPLAGNFVFTFTFKAASPQGNAASAETCTTELSWTRVAGEA